MKGRRRGHLLATILYTDIVGSSQLAAELGDRRWRTLLARHHLIVRKELKRHRGHEIDNAGDGFLAAFDDQEGAIRCACAIGEAVRVLGIEIRAGLHVGQAEVLGRKLGGIVVNTGARIMAEAGPGQVLVTGVMKDLVPGSGFGFHEVGERQLKGIDGRWPLFAVTHVDGKPIAPPLDAAEAASRLGSITPPPIVQRRWGKLTIAALSLVVASTVVIVVASREPPIQVRPNSLARIDGATGALVADVALNETTGSIPVAVPPDEIWVLGHPSEAIRIIDTSTNRVRSVAAPAKPAPYALAFAEDSVWMAADVRPGVGGPTPDTIVQFTPRTLLVLDEIELPVPRTERALLLTEDPDSGELWVAAHDALRVYEIDPRTNEIVRTAKMGVGLNGIAAGEGSVWVANYSSGTVSRIDPKTGDSAEIELWVRGKVGSNVYDRRGGPSNIAVGFGSVWVTDTKFGVVHRIAPATGEVVSTIPVGPESANNTAVTGIAINRKSVWITPTGSKALVRIDPITEEVEHVMTFPYQPTDVLVAYGDIWVLLTQ